MSRDNEEKVIRDLLKKYEHQHSPIESISENSYRNSLISQIQDSIRRVRYAELLLERDWSEKVADPESSLFDPLKAAAYFSRREMKDEAAWLVFLATHFGKSKESGWLLTREVYGRCGQNERWTWEAVTQDPKDIKHWLAADYQNKISDGNIRKFSNHRKYESLKPEGKTCTGAVIESYLKWVLSYGSHQAMREKMIELAGNDKTQVFEHMYQDMKKVLRFGRLARFDFLCMIGKLGILNIAPTKLYLKESTGPKKGAKLLFGAGHSSKTLEKFSKTLGDSLELGDFQCQILEDALCNWQKSPGAYKKFDG